MKVLFDNKNRAIGVTYLRDGQERILFAKKEVILSAGAIASPQLLLLSGIGPKKHLQEKGKYIMRSLLVNFIVKNKSNLPEGKLYYVTNFTTHSHFRWRIDLLREDVKRRSIE